MTPGKRALDLLVLAAIAPLILPIGLLLALAILVVDGRPVIYKQERMRSATDGFVLWKFRTMRPDPEDGGASGGHKAARVTRLGRFLRRSKFDELPQAVNVLRGDITLVGPRPPLRVYVEDYPEIYGPVLRSRPGLTGLASFFYSRHESWLLERCETAAQTEAVYRRRCIPRKARLDLIYQRHQSVLLDFWIFWWTTARILRLPGGRAPKIRYRRRRDARTHA